MAGDKMTIGRVEITSLSDAVLEYSPSRLYPSVPDEAWQPHHRKFFTPEGNLSLNVACYLMRSEGRTILVDTGVGRGPSAILDGVRGQLMQEFQIKGLSVDDVDTVVITHLHPDHVGWNLTETAGKYRPTFPRARCLISQVDWDFFRQPQTLERYPYMAESVLPLEDMGNVDFIPGETSITGEVSTISTPGHTPGHISVVIASQGERGIVIGDVAHSLVQAHESHWNCGFDADPEQAGRTRTELLDRLEREGFLVAAVHFPSPGFGRFLRQDSRRYWQAL